MKRKIDGNLFLGKMFKAKKKNLKKEAHLTDMCKNGLFLGKTLIWCKILVKLGHCRSE